MLAIGGLMFAGRPDIWLPEASPMSHALWLAACGFGLLMFRRTPAPAFLHGIFAAIASASFYIYLTHVGPVHVLYWMQHINNTSTVVGAAVALGIVTWWLATDAPRALHAWASKRRQVRA